MQSHFYRKLALGVGIAITLLLVTALLARIAFQQQLDRADQVAQHHKIIDQIQTVQKLVVDMEAGRRGFRATNQHRFLQPYYQGQRRIGPEMAHLQTFFLTDPDQLERFRRVERQINQLLLFWEKLGEDASGYTRPYITRIMDQEKVRMDQIWSLSNALLEEERNKLYMQQQQAVAAVNRANGALWLGTIATLSIIIGMGYLIYQTLRKNQLTQLELTRTLQERQLLLDDHEQKNYLLAGLDVINQSVQGVMVYSLLAQSALQALLSYLKIPAGGYYEFDPEARQLRLQAIIAFTTQTATSYQVGEGLVGQAATAQDLYIVSGVPEQYWTIRSATGSSRPIQLVFVPLWHNNHLEGVIELGLFEPLNATKQELIRKAGRTIAMALYTLNKSRCA